MDKRALIKKIVTQLRAELGLLLKAARSAHAEATHESSKAENKYDTRGLEASYLARGQSRQLAEAEKALQQFESLTVRKFGPSEPIDLTALIELEGKKEHAFYFLAPQAGGTEIVCNGQEVLVITPQSPLGQQLMGKRKGDRLQLAIAGQRNQYRVVSVA